MNESGILKIHETASLDKATLVLAFTGWMDGGDVSTGTVQHLVHVLHAKPIAEIDPEPFYIYNVPGPMEVAELFRPPVAIEAGLVKQIELPSNIFYGHTPANLVLFVGKEPHLRWRTFGECILPVGAAMGHPADRLRRLIRRPGAAHPPAAPVRHVLDCGLAAGNGRVRRPPQRLSGPASFATYLMTQAAAAGLDMISLVAEVPGYLQGTNPASIEAVTRRLAKLLQLHLDLAPLRSASTVWELRVSQVVEKNGELAETVHKLEEAYDNELLRTAPDQA